MNRRERSPLFGSNLWHSSKHSNNLDSWKSHAATQQRTAASALVLGLPLHLHISSFFTLHPYKAGR